jgi:hypothetical protein
MDHPTNELTTTHNLGRNKSSDAVRDALAWDRVKRAVRCSAEKPADSTAHNQPDMARLSPHQRAGRTPPRPGSRPRGRPRKNSEPVTVYDRDAGVGQLPTNLSVGNHRVTWFS